MPSNGCARSRGIGNYIGCNTGGCLTSDYRGVAVHHSRPPSGGCRSTEEEEEDKHGTGHSDFITACPTITCGDNAQQGASHAAISAGTNLAQEDLQGSGIGDDPEPPDSHHGGDAIGSSSHRYASPPSDGGGLQEGGRSRVHCGSRKSTVQRPRPPRNREDTNTPQRPAGIVASSAQ